MNYIVDYLLILAIIAVIINTIVIIIEIYLNNKWFNCIYNKLFNNNNKY